MLLYYVLITLPCPTIARWTVGFKCCTYCEYKITIMLPSLVQLYTEPSNATHIRAEYSWFILELSIAGSY